MIVLLRNDQKLKVVDKNSRRLQYLHALLIKT
jgi:hypothetical protein